MDNSDAIMYNKDRNYAPFKPPATDPLSQWKEKNQGLLKYAGDRAKKSINAGLEEASDFMRDADEGTSFENVQTASVKRRLANDANDSKLYNSATMEMIGHLSKENKGPYLKAVQPLQKYIEAKDEFDFKHNNYTTTENVDKTPDENVRQLQRELNEAGYTDKFGQKLKEDGIYAGKTAYADDRYREDIDKTNTNTNNYAMMTLKKGNKYNSAPYLNGLQFARHNIDNEKFSVNDFMKVVAKINNGAVLSTADYALSGIYWFFSVDNDGKWDYKRLNDDDKHRKMAPNWWPEQNYFMYYGKIIADDDFGNINYGYLGTILGLSPETLYKGGGMLNNNPTPYEKEKYYGDSEVDHIFIEKGIKQANDLGYRGYITLPDFVFDLLKEYVKR